MIFYDSKLEIKNDCFFIKDVLADRKVKVLVIMATQGIS